MVQRISVELAGSQSSSYRPCRCIKQDSYRILLSSLFLVREDFKGRFRLYLSFSPRAHSTSCVIPDHAYTCRCLQAIVIRDLPISASGFALSRIGLASQILSSAPRWWHDLATTVPRSFEYIDGMEHTQGVSVVPRSGSLKILNIHCDKI